MLASKEFFQKYNISEEQFSECGIKWDELEEIFENYSELQLNLEPTAKYVFDCLQRAEEIHSLKIRIKNPEHLIEKIIRKKIDDHKREISIENYRTEITDLIGIRVLHLFKEDWKQIHDYISKQWELHEEPTAYVRKGDSKEYSQQFLEKGCEIKEHPSGYRSIHYIVKSKPSVEMHFVEIQVRTIFEEGWSEIDHRIRYPYEMENPILNRYLSIFNRLAGSADEMGTFLKMLKLDLIEKTKLINKAKEERDQALRELNDQVRKLNISEKEKDRLEKRIKKLSESSPVSNDIFVNAEYPGIKVYGETSGIYLNEVFCSECGKDITGTVNAIIHPPLCSVCQMSPSIIINQKCDKCGAELDYSPFVATGGPQLCLKCLLSNHDITP